MADTGWQLTGDYFETCNGDYLCLCQETKGQGVPGRGDPGEPIHLDNTGHPASNPLALAKATRSHVHAFGTGCDEDGGLNNGHFASFNRQGP